MCAAVEKQFREAGLGAPPAEDVIDQLSLKRVSGRKIVRFLIEEATLIKVSDELVVHREHIETLVRNIKARKERKPQLGVVEFKELTGLSRKYAIPLLEYLDRQRVTRRLGNERLIN